MLERLLPRSITRKAVLILLVLVTLPLLTFSFMFYWNSARLMTDQAIKDRTTAVKQLTDNLSTALLSLENLSRDLVYRSNVLALLRKTDLNAYPILSARYTEQIILAVKYSLKYQRLDIEDVCIYSDNETIREQSYFYHGSQLVGLKCYDDFIASGAYQQLCLLSASEAQDYYARKSGRDAYASGRVLYMRLIQEESGRRLGVLVFEFIPAQIFRSVLSVPGCFVVLGEDGRVYGAAPGADVLEAVLGASGEASTAELGTRVYPFARIDKFNVTVGTNQAVDRDIYGAQALKLSALIGLLALLQLLVLYVLTKHIFGKVNRSISAMDAIVQDGYHGHVPVKGTDELAQIAMRYNTVLDHVDELVSANVKKETAHKSAQIQALQYQMNPHFIYNTLTVFSGQAEKEGNYALSEAISYFGQLLRYNIRNGGLYATLEQELTNARSLFKVYELKYPGCLALLIDAGPEVQALKIIKYVIQPLLENSLLHGRKGTRGMLTVRIVAREQEGVLSLVVEDNGAGIEPGRLEAACRGDEPAQGGDSSSIGLKNIRDRIRLFYGQEGSFRIDSEQGRYTRVSIRIPIRSSDAQVFGGEAQV